MTSLAIDRHAQRSSPVTAFRQSFAVWAVRSRNNILIIHGRIDHDGGAAQW
jgi:hypothetical protein